MRFDKLIILQLLIRSSEPVAPPMLSEVSKLVPAPEKKSSRTGVLVTFGIILSFVLGYVCGVWGLYFWFMTLRTG